MTAFYDRMVLSSHRQIKAKGQTVTLIESTPGQYDTATGAPAAASTVTQYGYAVEESYSSFSIDGTLIQIGDKKLILSPLNTADGPLTAPQRESTVTLADASVWTVKKCDPTSPAGTPVLYTLQVRQ